MSQFNLRNKISIQRRTNAQDTTGQVQEVWANSAYPWAQVRPITGREYFSASGERAEVTHEITIRHGPTVTPRDRVLYDDRLFDIRSVIDIDERHQYVALMCVEYFT